VSSGELAQARNPDPSFAIDTADVSSVGRTFQLLRVALNLDFTGRGAPRARAAAAAPAPSLRCPSRSIEEEPALATSPR
jgi:hypothetical protein